MKNGVRSVVWVQTKHSNTGLSSAASCTADIFRGKGTPTDPSGILVQARAGQEELEAFVSKNGWVQHECHLANALGVDIEVNVYIISNPFLARLACASPWRI